MHSRKIDQILRTIDDGLASVTVTFPSHGGTMTLHRYTTTSAFDSQTIREDLCTIGR